MTRSMLGPIKVNLWAAGAAGLVLAAAGVVVLWTGIQWWRALLGAPRTISLFVLSEGCQVREGLIEEGHYLPHPVEGVEADVTAEIGRFRIHTDASGLQSFHAIIRDPSGSGYRDLVDRYDGRHAVVFVGERPICLVRLSRVYFDRVVLAPGREPTIDDYYRSMAEIKRRLFLDVSATRGSRGSTRSNLLDF
jgi:hypothetical protein